MALGNLGNKVPTPRLVARMFAHIQPLARLAVTAVSRSGRFGSASPAVFQMRTAFVEDHYPSLCPGPPLIGAQPFWPERLQMRGPVSASARAWPLRKRSLRSFGGRSLRICSEAQQTIYRAKHCLVEISEDAPRRLRGV